MLETAPCAKGSSWRSRNAHLLRTEVAVRSIVSIFVVLAAAIAVAGCDSGDATAAPRPSVTAQPMSIGIKNGTVISGTQVQIDFVQGEETVPVNIWRDGSTEIECAVKQGSQVTVLGYGTRLYLGGETERQPLVQVVGSSCTGVLLRDWLVRNMAIVETPVDDPNEATMSAETAEAISVATREVDATQTAQAANTPSAGLLLKVLQNANLREGPSTDDEIVGGVSAGESVEVIARNSTTDWLYVRVSGLEAWIAKFLVEDVELDDVPVGKMPGVGDQ
ncbi:MAG: SH3 domain-containing protein [Caldilineaceae bacterium]|nr:SH3 domain-containing protein [Caldilineaceae bacterium]